MRRVGVIAEDDPVVGSGIGLADHIEPMHAPNGNCQVLQGDEATDVEKHLEVDLKSTACQATCGTDP